MYACVELQDEYILLSDLQDEHIFARSHLDMEG